MAGVGAEEYKDVLETELLPQAKKLFGSVKGKFTYQHDHARAHTAQMVQDVFPQHAVKLLDWPGNSPDLNPIENAWQLVE